jgi:hypothetical protein
LKIEGAPATARVELPDGRELSGRLVVDSAGVVRFEPSDEEEVR